MTSRRQRWLSGLVADGVVGLLGIPELTLQASNLKLEVTRAATDGSLVDFALTPVVVATGAGATTLLAAEVTVDQGLVQTPVPGAALLVTFAAGGGRVVFIAWELDAAWSEAVSDLVFPTVMPHKQG